MALIIGVMGLAKVQRWKRRSDAEEAMRRSRPRIKATQDSTMSDEENAKLKLPKPSNTAAKLSKTTQPIGAESARHAGCNTQIRQSDVATLYCHDTNIASLGVCCQQNPNGTCCLP